MSSIQIPGICDSDGVVVQSETQTKKEQSKKYKLALDFLDGSITIVECTNGRELDQYLYRELQELTEAEVNVLGTEIADHAYDENLDIHCERCNKFYRPYCRLHPLFKIPDRVFKPDPARKGGKTYSEQTLPVLFNIEKSKLPNAGLGVVATAFIPIGMVFGPYKGVRCQKKSEFHKDGYAWVIRSGDKRCYIDGSDPERSNWLRYINSPRHDDEQNMIAFQTNGKIFYRVVKPVRIGQELLVYYGGSYGEEFVYSDDEKPKKSGKNPFIRTTTNRFRRFPCRLPV